MTVTECQARPVGHADFVLFGCLVICRGLVSYADLHHRAASHYLVWHLPYCAVMVGCPRSNHLLRRYLLCETPFLGHSVPAIPFDHSFIPCARLHQSPCALCHQVPCVYACACGCACVTPSGLYDKLSVPTTATRFHEHTASRRSSECRLHVEGLEGKLYISACILPQACAPRSTLLAAILEPYRYPYSELYMVSLSTLDSEWNDCRCCNIHAAASTSSRYFFPTSQQC
jgi:hypothetical protein